jgi:hypothetical protein
MWYNYKYITCRSYSDATSGDNLSGIIAKEEKRMSRSEFTKRWDKINGFSMAEAIEKKAAVDEAHGVGQPNSKWAPAEIVPDESKTTGFKVVIATI